MKLFGSTEKKINKDKNSENIPHVEITEVALNHCNIVINDCQKDSRVSCEFVLNKSSFQLFGTSPKSVFLKKNNSKFSYIEVCFTDQNFKPLGTEDKITL